MLGVADKPLLSQLAFSMYNRYEALDEEDQ